MSTPAVPGISATPATGTVPNLTGLQLPKPLTDAVSQSFTLTYSLRDSQAQLQQVVARMVQYGTKSVRQATNPQAVPDGALFFETDTQKSYQARLASRQTTRLWYELVGGVGGAFIRTINFFTLVPGTSIAPYVPIYSGGPGMRAIGVLRKTITADLVITITRNAETSPLFTFTLPASTPVATDVVMDISSITFADLDVLKPAITASDSSSDADGVATLTIEWSGALSGSGTGGGTGGSGFTAGGDLAGSPTSQAVVGLEGVPLDATTVSTPTDGQTIVYDAATAHYKAATPAPGFTAGGDLSGTSTSQTVIALEGKPLDAATVGSPTDGQVIEWNAASGHYKAVTPASGFTAGGDLSGSSTAQTVTGLEDKPLDAATVGSPADGQVITWNAAAGKYKAANPTGGFTAGGDLSGTSTSQTVKGLDGIAFDTSMTTPSNGQVVQYDSTLGKWKAVTPGTSGGGAFVIGFVIVDGSQGVNVGPMLIAPSAGSLVKCVVVVKTSDSLVGMNFDIKRNNVSVFTSTPAIGAGTATGATFTFTTLVGGTIAVVAGDVFLINISSGSSAWQFTTQLE